VSIKTGQLEFQHFTASIDKLYTGKLYTVEPYMSRCVVTSNHQMLVSPARRNSTTNYSYNYFPEKASWQLVPFCELTKGWRSWFHIRRAVEPREEEYPVTDDYLKLAGFFLSEGSLSFRKDSVKDGRISQTLKGKREFYKIADSLSLTRYDYNKETVWRIKRPLAEQLYRDFGHGSLNKRLPPWCLKLSYRQARLFFHALWLGDGTETPNGDCYYTCNKELADDIQAMLISAGCICSVRGPYKSIIFDGREVASYQIYVSNEDGFRCVNFKNRLLDGEEAQNRKGYPIKERLVTKCRVVCFEVPNGTLVTRNKGCVAIQGNCKFAYHVVRLLDEVEQILSEGDLDIRRNRAQLKAIRRGDVPEEEIYKYGPDEAAIKRLLLECLEEHWGSLTGAVVLEDSPILALREVAEVIDRNRHLLG